MAKPAMAPVANAAAGRMRTGAPNAAATPIAITGANDAKEFLKIRFLYNFISFSGRGPPSNLAFSTFLL